MENCIFCKIIKGEIPASKMYEDENMIIFKDIDPKAEKHYLCVPKSHFKLLADMNEASAEYLMLQTRQQLAVNSLSLASKSASSILSLF